MDTFVSDADTLHYFSKGLLSEVCVSLLGSKTDKDLLKLLKVVLEYFYDLVLFLVVRDDSRHFPVPSVMVICILQDSTSVFSPLCKH